MTTDSRLHPGLRIDLAQANRIVHQHLAGLSKCAFLSEADFVQLTDRLVSRWYTAGEVILMKGVRDLEAAHPAIPIHIYDAGHGFSCDERASFDAPSHKAALDRTLAFFCQHLA